MNILYNNLEKHLIEIDSPFSLVETFGYLSGFASSNCSFDSYKDGLLKYFYIDSDSESENLNLDLLRDIIMSII